MKAQSVKAESVKAQSVKAQSVKARTRTAAREPMRVCRVHWGCGDIRPAGWINIDIGSGPRIDISCDVREGIPLPDTSVDYISSQHALQEISILEQGKALRELWRILKPGGVLRMGLPDLDRAIACYLAGRNDYFEWDWDTLSGNFITFILDYNYTRTPFTYEFAEELLKKAGFKDVCRVSYRETKTAFPEIVELDNRESESFYFEAIK